jgi:hypothetical protein
MDTRSPVILVAPVAPLSVYPSSCHASSSLVRRFSYFPSPVQKCTNPTLPQDFSYQSTSTPMKRDHSDPASLAISHASNHGSGRPSLGQATHSSSSASGVPIPQSSFAQSRKANKNKRRFHEDSHSLRPVKQHRHGYLAPNESPGSVQPQFAGYPLSGRDLSVEWPVSPEQLSNLLLPAHHGTRHLAQHHQAGLESTPPVLPLSPSHFPHLPIDDCGAILLAFSHDRNVVSGSHNGPPHPSPVNASWALTDERESHDQSHHVARQISAVNVPIPNAVRSQVNTTTVVDTSQDPSTFSQNQNPLALIPQGPAMRLAQKGATTATHSSRRQATSISLVDGSTAYSEHHYSLPDAVQSLNPNPSGPSSQLLLPYQFPSAPAFSSPPVMSNYHHTLAPGLFASSPPLEPLHPSSSSSSSSPSGPAKAMHHPINNPYTGDDIPAESPTTNSSLDFNTNMQDYEILSPEALLECSSDQESISAGWMHVNDRDESPLIFSENTQAIIYGPHPPDDGFYLSGANAVYQEPRNKPAELVGEYNEFAITAQEVRVCRGGRLAITYEPAHANNECAALHRDATVDHSISEIGQRLKRLASKVPACDVKCKRFGFVLPPFTFAYFTLLYFSLLFFSFPFLFFFSGFFF